MTSRAHLQRKILELVPTDRFISASEVVDTLSSTLPAKAVWAQLVLLAFDGAIVAEHPGRYDGRAMVRRALTKGARP